MARKPNLVDDAILFLVDSKRRWQTATGRFVIRLLRIAKLALGWDRKDRVEPDPYEDYRGELPRAPEEKEQIHERDKDATSTTERFDDDRKPTSDSGEGR